MLNAHSNLTADKFRWGIRDARKRLGSVAAIGIHPSRLPELFAWSPEDKANTMYQVTIPNDPSGNGCHGMLDRVFLYCDNGFPLDGIVMVWKNVKQATDLLTASTLHLHYNIDFMEELPCVSVSPAI